MKNSTQYAILNTLYAILIALVWLVLPHAECIAATLTITANNGSVTATPDKAQYDYGELVQLIPKPETGYYFTGWGGDARGKSLVLNLAMDSDKAIIANFDTWQPPIGIPMPSFGIFETYRMYDDPAKRNPALTYTQNAEGGYYTHYVDNTAGNATDSSSYPGVTDYSDLTNHGTLTKPRNTVPVNLPEGSVVEVHGGPYTYSTSGGGLIFCGTGTAAKPIFIRGFDPTTRSQFTHHVLLGLDPNIYGWYAHYIIVENLDFYGTVDARDISFSILAPTHHAAVRNCYIHGVAAHSIGLFVHTYAEYIATPVHDILVYGCKIYDLGHMDEGVGDSDYVGLSVVDSNDVWIVDNEIFNAMGGIGIGQGQVGLPARRVYFGRNIIHDCLQAGMWCKWGEDIIFSQNEVYHMLISPNDTGKIGIATSCAAGYQDGPSGPNRLWYIFNRMHDLHAHNDYIDGGIAIVSGTTGNSGDVYYIGNEIYDIDGTAIMGWRSTPNLHIVGNTIHKAGAGMDFFQMFGGVQISNNIISEIEDPNWDLTLQYSAHADLSSVNNNLFYNATRGAKIDWGSYTNDTIAELQQETGKFAGCIEADPLFVNASNNNFNLLNGSPAIDSGIESEVYQKFYDLYGIDIKKDIENKIRSQDGDNNGSAEWDIGAYEYGENYPTSYEGFGAVTRGALDAPEGYEVYHVTNLDDSVMYQNGTLRYGLLYEGGYTPGKGLYVVFDVAGTIELGTNYLITHPYLTIDGSTAPYPGITLDTRIKDANGTVYSSLDFSIETRDIRGPVHDVIINNLRFIGPGAAFSKDILAIDGTDQPVSRVIIDHVSADAAGDGIFDMRGEVSDVTLSWNLITGTSVATAFTGDVLERTRISMHHNVYANNSERQPKIKSKTTMVDLVNNVVYGWSWLEGSGKGLQLEPPDNSSLADPNIYPSANIIGNNYHYVNGVDYWGLKRTNSKNELCIGLIYFEDNIFPPGEDEDYDTSEKLIIPTYAEVTKYNASTLGDTVVPYVGTHYPTSEEQNILQKISIAIGGHSSSEVILGDVNEDGEISAYDAALAAHIAVDLEHPDIKNRAAAEVSGDGEISAYDAALIAQRAVGLIEKFPVE